MPAIKLDLDQETYARLAEQAVAERRPVDWQAEVALRRALGLPFPHVDDGDRAGGQPVGVVRPEIDDGVG